MSENVSDEAAQFAGLPEDPKASDTARMTAVANLGANGVWIEMLSQQDANRISLLSGTAVHIFYAQEEQQEGGHPRRWFALVRNVEGSQRAEVCLAVTPQGAAVRDSGFLPSGVHTTGFRNANPYPEFADEVERLAEAVGLEIAPNWQGQILGAAPSP